MRALRVPASTWRAQEVKRSFTLKARALERLYDEAASVQGGRELSAEEVRRLLAQRTEADISEDDVKALFRDWGLGVTTNTISREDFTEAAMSTKFDRELLLRAMGGSAGSWRAGEVGARLERVLGHALTSHGVARALRRLQDREEEELIPFCLLVKLLYRH